MTNEKYLMYIMTENCFRDLTCTLLPHWNQLKYCTTILSLFTIWIDCFLGVSIVLMIILFAIHHKFKMWRMYTYVYTCRCIFFTKCMYNCIYWKILCNIRARFWLYSSSRNQSGSTIEHSLHVWIREKKNLNWVFKGVLRIAWRISLNGMVHVVTC